MRKSIIIIFFSIFVLSLLPILYYVFIVHSTGPGSLGVGILEIFFAIVAAVSLLITIVALIFSKSSDTTVVNPTSGVLLKTVLCLIGGGVSYLLLILLIPLFAAGTFNDLKNINIIAIPGTVIVTILLFIISLKKRNA